MKCNYCGNNLPENADFCPECGMIISLGDSAAEPEVTQAEPEVPEFTPNVFKAMDFEEAAAEPAMELKADEKEETAPVVEAIPEYVPEEPKAEPLVEESDAADEAVEDGFAPEAESGEFTPPEYTSELSYLDEKEQVEETPATQAQVLFGSDAVEPAPEETSGDTIVMNLDQIKQAQQEIPEEPEVKVPVEEDNSLIEALFDSSVYAADKRDDIEDITNAHNAKIKKEKEKKQSSNKGYVMVFALVAVLVAIIFAAGHVVDNVLPKIKDKDKETTSGVIATGTTEPTTTTPITKEPASTTTTNPSSTSTTNPSSTSSTNPSSASSTSTTQSGAMTTTRPTTTAPTTTTRPTTTAPTTTQSSSTVKTPSSWNMNTTVFFPSSGSITVRYSPSSSSATMGTHPYGYPLWAFAKENGYYYVESAYLGVYGWVSTSGLNEYVTTTATTTRPTTTKPTTTRPSTTTTTTTTTTTQPTTAYDDGYKEYESAYTATITPPDNDALNFRSGPGTQYTIKATVPYGYIVTVHGYSTTNPDWVYVEVTDSRYAQYGSAEGWVYKAYIA